jgi:hypothetical protein
VAKRHLKPILKAAELPATFRLYDTRHTCATLLRKQLAPDSLLAMPTCESSTPLRATEDARIRARRTRLAPRQRSLQATGEACTLRSPPF